jgi:UDP-3-O-[3-hydroxymyristoyl] glucosamine N-acyltransferase
MIGGQVGIIGHLQIADGVKIAAQSGVGTSIGEESAVIQGSPAFNYGKYQRSYVVFKKLPEIYRKMMQLEQEIRELKSGKAGVEKRRAVKKLILLTIEFLFIFRTFFRH